MLDSINPGAKNEFDFGVMPNAWELLDEQQAQELRFALNSLSISNPEAITTDMYNTLARAINAARRADPGFDGSVIPILNEVLGVGDSDQSQSTESEPGGSGERAMLGKKYTTLTEEAREILSNPKSDMGARETAEKFLEEFPTVEAYLEAMLEQTKD